LRGPLDSPPSFSWKKPSSLEYAAFLSALYQFFDSRVLVDSLSSAVKEVQIQCTRPCFVFAFIVPGALIKRFTFSGLCSFCLLLALDLNSLCVCIRRSSFSSGEIRLELSDLTQLQSTLGADRLKKVIVASRKDVPDREISICSLSAFWRPSSPPTPSLAAGVCSLVVGRSRMNKLKVTDSKQQEETPDDNSDDKEEDIRNTS